MPQISSGLQVQLLSTPICQSIEPLVCSNPTMILFQPPCWTASNPLPRPAITNVTVSSPSQRKEGFDRPAHTLNSAAVPHDRLIAALPLATSAPSRLGATSMSAHATDEGLHLLATVAGSKHRCSKCGITSTPKWRCAGTLCNACGLHKFRYLSPSTV